MATSEKKFQIVLAGNPNSGKSTIFNELTGARQHVGNYPGVTVEKKEGWTSYEGRAFHVIDLPGQYSMSPHSEDEEAARSFIQENCGNLQTIIVNIVDAANFERNLFLTLQLRQLGTPMILVLNMVDLARRRGFEFRKGEISKWLRLPALECVGFTGEGVADVLKECADIANQIESGSYSSEAPQWLLDLNEKGLLPTPITAEDLGNAKVPETLRSADVATNENSGKDAASRNESETASLYYSAISRILPEMLYADAEKASKKTSVLDRVFLHRFLGLPLFFLMLFLIFQLTFTIGEYPMGWIEGGVEALSEKIGSFWSDDSESLLKSLILDGIIGGVGGVIVFLPNIFFLFLAISLLEDSGYMSRAAVLMDRFMAKIGLHGKSFIPMLVGFGCSVPGVMATRTLENRRERIATIFVLPLMSCGARMPIYALLIPAFFPTAWNGTVLFSIYILGIVLALVLAKLMSLTVLRGESIPFVLELSPWHVPTFRTVGIKTLERCWIYLKKAGTIILGISILLWCLTTFPQLPEEKAQLCESEEAAAEMALEFSGAGRIGKAIEPVMQTMGMDWKIGTAFLGAFAAKEVFVAQMGIVYQCGDVEEDDSSLREVMQKKYSPLIGYCLLIFALVSAPCMATFAVVVREAGWKWALAQWFGLTFLAWLLCTGVYQIGIHCFGL